MNFAESILKKYGWSDGQGLGKTNEGIVKPIKATFKFDNTGLGHDSGTDFTNRWWERVYNDAANNVNVSRQPGGKTAITINEEDAVDISTSSVNFKKLHKKHKKNSGVGSFIKSATLNMGQEDVVDEPIHLEEFQHRPVKQLTDEELLAACGGRTAHKGARHGLKLSGKLARMAAADEALAKRLNGNDAADAALTPILYQTEYSKASKRKKRQNNKLDLLLSDGLDSSCSIRSPDKAITIPESSEQAEFNVDEARPGKAERKRKRVAAALEEETQQKCSKKDVPGDMDSDTDAVGEKGLKRKRKRNREAKAEKRMAKAFAASLSVSE